MRPGWRIASSPLVNQILSLRAQLNTWRKVLTIWRVLTRNSSDHIPSKEKNSYHLRVRLKELTRLRCLVWVKLLRDFRLSITSSQVLEKLQLNQIILSVEIAVFSFNRAIHKCRSNKRRSYSSQSSEFQRQLEAIVVKLIAGMVSTTLWLSNRWPRTSTNNHCNRDKIKYVKNKKLFSLSSHIYLKLLNSYYH